jgi:hypothetical protein
LRRWIETRVGTLSIEFDHAIVPARDPRAAAELLVRVLGVPWAESGAGPFCPVFVNEGRTLDFDPDDGTLLIPHDRFRVTAPEFDGIVTGIRTRGIEYRSPSHGPADLPTHAR